MVPKPRIRCLLTASIGLPIVMVVVAAFGRLLTALGDATGGRFLERIAFGCGIVWVLALIGLLLTVAAQIHCNERADDEHP